MKPLWKTTRRAVTLTELLVVLAIISLLATIAVPVYVQKTEQARRATARFEVRAIAEAQESVALTHGFYVPIHILDNLPNDADDDDVRDDFDNHTEDNQVYVIDPYTDLFTQEGNQITLNQGLSGANTRVANMIQFWSGPFLNPNRVATDNTRTDQNVTLDTVLDPWGRPYLFYSPIGIIANQDYDDLTDFSSTPAGVTRILYDNGELQDQSNGTADLFDRYAIISYGANGVRDRTNSGDPANSDDVYYTFGFTPNESAYNNL